jgi:hypothetical protein
LLPYDKLDIDYWSKFEILLDEIKRIFFKNLLLTKDQYNFYDIYEDIVIDVVYHFVRIHPNKYYIYYFHLVDFLDVEISQLVVDRFHLQLALSSILIYRVLINSK